MQRGCEYHDPPRVRREVKVPEFILMLFGFHWFRPRACREPFLSFLCAMDNFSSSMVQVLFAVRGRLCEWDVRDRKTARFARMIQAAQCFRFACFVVGDVPNRYSSSSTFSEDVFLCHSSTAEGLACITAEPAGVASDACCFPRQRFSDPRSAGGWPGTRVMTMVSLGA